MLTITLNTFENIDKKIYNDPGKTLGDMYIYFMRDLLLLHSLCSIPSFEEVSRIRSPSNEAIKMLCGQQKVLQ